LHYDHPGDFVGNFLLTTAGFDLKGSRKSAKGKLTKKRHQQEHLFPVRQSINDLG